MTESYCNNPFDALPVPGATLSDLDLQRFEEEYLPRAVGTKILATAGLSVEEWLLATNMACLADRPVPTLTGLLMVGKRPRDFFPGAYVRFWRAGAGQSDKPSERAELEGTVADVIRLSVGKFKMYGSAGVDRPGTSDEGHPNYPLAALREFMGNAVMHRAYEGSDAPIRVNWFDDRIEIVNPGGPYGNVTVDNFGRDGWTDFRNPNLANAMRAFGLVERGGIGLHIARKQLKRNGKAAPEFRVDSGHVFCTVRKAKK